MKAKILWNCGNQNSECLIYVYGTDEIIRNKIKELIKSCGHLHYDEGIIAFITCDLNISIVAFLIDELKKLGFDIGYKEEFKEYKQIKILLPQLQRALKTRDVLGSRPVLDVCIAASIKNMYRNYATYYWMEKLINETDH